MSSTEFDIESYWEYGDPAGSEQRFRQALDSAEGDIRLELLTQIARTYSLRSDFEAAHSTLDAVESQLAEAGPRPRVRYLLERGRSHNSAGHAEAARSLFEQAWGQASAADLEGLAVDAAHMVAITYSGASEALEWNVKGLEIARGSSDAKAYALVPAMLNNRAWDLHDMGRYEEALPAFQEALDAWSRREKPKQIRIARWSIARCLRSLGRHEEALEILRELESAGPNDGFVYEELAENLIADGQETIARSYFKLAADELSKDDWFVENEAGRLARLKAKSEGKNG